jgi:hypothetical protein
MNRTINYIVSAKGGVGKSILSYEWAVYSTHKNRNDILFVDLDNSTQTSTKQLKFLGENQLETISLLNEKEVLVRDNLVSYLESLSASTFEEIVFDLGNPESEQMPALIERDLPFAEFMNELGFNAVFNVVIGGGGAYRASVEYLQKLLKVLKGEFEVVVWLNITSFSKFPELASELEKNCHTLGLKLKRFGNFDPSSNLGSSILDGIRKGYGLSDYATGARLALKNDLIRTFEDGK